MSETTLGEVATNQSAVLDARRIVDQIAPSKAPFDMDALYDVNEIAPWLGMAPRSVLELARRKKLPVVRFNERVLRFHPRSILLAKGGKV